MILTSNEPMNMPMNMFSLWFYINQLAGDCELLVKHLHHPGARGRSLDAAFNLLGFMTSWVRALVRYGVSPHGPYSIE